MEKIKVLVNSLAVAFGIAFMDGAFNWGLSESVYVFIGGVIMVILVWLLVLVNKKQ